MTRQFRQIPGPEGKDFGGAAADGDRSGSGIRGQLPPGKTSQGICSRTAATTLRSCEQVLASDCPGGRAEMILPDDGGGVVAGTCDGGVAGLVTWARMAGPRINVILEEQRVP